MPGPGGGSHGGGFGGGSHGGFGGGSRGGFGYGYHGGWMFRRPYYGRGGGCLSGFMGMLMLPIILIVFVGIYLVGFVGSAITNVSNGGQITYDEATFQTYANDQYAIEFESSSAYEDNLLIVFLTNEDADGFYAIAWVGDNIKSDITNMFGNERTLFGKTLSDSVNGTYYGYSLGSNLASVMETMTKEITKLGPDSSFRTEANHSRMTVSHLTNHTDLTISEQTVDAALTTFTEETDIPAVIVVDTMENVFGKTIATGDIVTMVVMLALLALAIFLIVRAFRNRKGNNSRYQR